MKWHGIKKHSDRGKLRKEIGNIHFQILKLKRGEKDEIDGRPANGLGRFHILEVSTNPRLEFCDDNVLLVNWLPNHFNWHHYGEGSPRNAFTKKRIEELRGIDYREKLMERERFCGKMDSLYLQCLLETMQKELNQLIGEKR